MNRTELADFLRRRRAVLRPEDVGLVQYGRRRIPGLRREEVAWLAGVSANYYERLEQARGPRPSPQVIAALAAALRLSDVEREYLATLAGQVSSGRTEPSDTVSPGVLRLLHRLGPLPAYVLNARHDVLAWNAMAVALFMDFSVLSTEERNLVRLSAGRGWCAGASEPDAFARQLAADLRRAAARYPSDSAIGALVSDYATTSPEFDAGWRAHDVRSPRTFGKSINHPEFGLLDLDCEVLELSGDDQFLVIYSAEPGSREHDILQRMQLGIPAAVT